MSTPGVEFDEDKFGYSGARMPGQNTNPTATREQSYYAQHPGPTGNEPKMVQFLLRHGLAKSPNSAQVILIVIVIVNVIITYVVIKYFL